VGMYSFFETEDIEMKDFEGCKKFIKNFVVALGGKKKDKDWKEDRKGQQRHGKEEKHKGKGKRGKED